MPNSLPLLVLKRLLAAEPWAGKLLAAHAGKTARLDLGGFSLCVTVSNDGEFVPAESDAIQDVFISVPAQAIAGLLNAPDQLRGSIRIEGNALFAETLATVLQHLRPDLAGHLAPWIGDPAAHRVAHAVNNLAKATFETARKFGHASAGFLRDDARLIVGSTELKAFCADLELLRNRLLDFEQRL